MKEPCWKYAIFCFHPKFDTGTWTIAAAFSTVIIFSALFFITLAFSAPKCFCPEIYEHIDALSPAFKAIYAIAVFALLIVVVVSIMCMYGTFKAQAWMLLPYVVTTGITFIVIFAGSIYIFILLANIDQYLLFDNDTYWNLAKMVLKEDLITQLEGMWSAVNVLLREFLNINMGDELNLNLLLDAALKDEVLILLGAGKRVMKMSAVLLLLGLNWLFISSMIVALSHWSRLRSRVVSHFTPVPNMILSQQVGSTSTRSTRSYANSDDYSGLSLRELKRMKSKSYKKSPGSITYSSSMKSSKKLYDISRLEVEGKFPREQFL